MPFESKSQLRMCYAKQFQAARKGKKSSWNCDRWLKETKRPHMLPERKGEYSGKRNKISKGPCTKGKKVCIGPRGGKYIIRGGIKIYV